MRGKSALHAFRMFAGVDVPHTQTTHAEQDALSVHARGKTRAVEIGVYEGANTVRIARALASAGRVFAVDPFSRGRLGVCWSGLVARRHIAASGVGARVTIVRALSWEAATRIEGLFDFVFIDGDHSLEGITRDWADWSPRIDVGGVIALHDTRASPLNPGVETLGSALYFESHIRHDARFRLVEQVDTMSVLERLPSV